jgi:hypothetical protein
MAVRLSLFARWSVTPLLLALAATAAAQDTNITRPIDELERLLAAEPLVITSAEISRPKAKGDITLKAEVSFGGAPPLRVKLRKAVPGAEEFNNVPRYDLAAYELQKLFIAPPEYVVPPTALRMVDLADFQKYQADVKRTFTGADQVLAVLQYWLSDITVVADVYDAARFERDPVYARHIGQLNILTHLIQHRDSNVGNFLIGKAQVGARVFSIDHGVAFASIDSDRGEAWKDMRVTRLPADTVAELRNITLPVLEQKLGVLAQWQLEDKKFVPAPLGPPLSVHRGVRREGKDLQMGLTRAEIQAVHRLLTKLLERVDNGEITTVPAPTAAAVATMTPAAAATN